MLSKNTCEGVHLIVKLQASKFTTNEPLHTYFSRILARFQVVFIVLFLGIISWKGVSCYNGGGGLFFRWGASFLSGGTPWGASILVWGGDFKKNHKMGGVGGGAPHALPLWRLCISPVIEKLERSNLDSW